MTAFRAVPGRRALAAAALLAMGGLSGCHVTFVQIEEDAIEPDAADGGDGTSDVVEDANGGDRRDVGEFEDEGPDADGDGGGEDAPVSRCGNGVLEPGEECDGAPPRPCLTACDSTGSQRCNDECRWDWDEGCVAPAEMCNGRDDDCDTVEDDGFDCVAGRRDECVVGACAGSRECGVGSCLWGACDLGPPPPNDLCRPTIPDIFAAGRFSGSMCGATGSHEGVCNGTSAGGPDLFFRLIVTLDAHVTIETAGAEFDALIFLYAGAPCVATVPLACDDHADGVTRVSRRLAPGFYWIVLDSESSSPRGRWTLDVTVR